MTKGEKKRRPKAKLEPVQKRSAADRLVAMVKIYERNTIHDMFAGIEEWLNTFNESDFSPSNQGDEERAEVSEALLSCANSMDKATVRLKEMAAKIGVAKSDVDGKLTVISNEGDN
jgi:hypothetical protein